jgi:hypothetical protein
LTPEWLTWSDALCVTGEGSYPCESNNVWLIQGMAQDTLTLDEPVSLAHIDVDWYEPVWTCLTRLEPCRFDDRSGPLVVTRLPPGR